MEANARIDTVLKRHGLTRRDADLVLWFAVRHERIKAILHVVCGADVNDDRMKAVLRVVKEAQVKELKLTGESAGKLLDNLVDSVERKTEAVFGGKSSEEWQDIFFDAVEEETDLPAPATKAVLLALIGVNAPVADGASTDLVAEFLWAAAKSLNLEAKIVARLPRPPPPTGTVGRIFVAAAGRPDVQAAVLALLQGNPGKAKDLAASAEMDALVAFVGAKEAAHLQAQAQTAAVKENVLRTVRAVLSALLQDLAATLAESAALWLAAKVSRKMAARLRDAEHSATALGGRRADVKAVVMAVAAGKEGLAAWKSLVQGDVADAVASAASAASAALVSAVVTETGLPEKRVRGILTKLSGSH
jgi:hypothetical protein